MESSLSAVLEMSSLSVRKKTVVDMLRSRPGFVSGQEISESLGISRNAVHKHVNSLRRRGYQILGVSRRGYCLEAEPEKLSMEVVARMTEQSVFGHAFIYHDEIESTNTEAKKLALQGAPEGTVVVAESQSAGRGRLGRRWESPSGKGLLFSVVLRPELPSSRVHLLALVVANAMAEAIEGEARIPVHLKWPNDLIVDNKKVGGVLLEVAGEQHGVDWVVAGIGTNVNTEFSELPVTLRKTATSLKIATTRDVDRSMLLARALLTLERVYRECSKQGFEPALRSFRERDYLLHRVVSVQTREGTVIGEAVGIDDSGALLVQASDRRTRRFHSGEVTLRR